MKHQLLILVAALAFLPVVATAQKAFDNVKYSDKSGALVIAFYFADGYPEASVLTLTDGGKSVRLATAGEELKFQGALAGKPVEVRLEMDPIGRAPKTVDANVVNAGLRQK